MPTYVIGDIQGCYDELQQLLEKINFDQSTDVLWFTGDLVNRGPHSLDVVRFIKSLGDQHMTVLGNHDLHLLAVAYGAVQLSRHDTFDDILSAPDKQVLIDWLRHRPLMHVDHRHDRVLVHAGLAPAWTVAEALALSHEVEAVLRGKAPASFLCRMYGNLPDQWRNDLKGIDRLRCIVNYLTRMRFCYQDGRLDLTYKGDIASKPADLIPWFQVPHRANSMTDIIFGHWAALDGKVGQPHLFALDTGCVWGNRLTAMRLHDGERFSVPSAACAKE